MGATFNRKHFCAYSNDGGTRDRSTSGGFLAECAKKFFSIGGVVYGGAYSGDFRKVVTTKVLSMEEYFSRLSKSKYSFCFIPDMAQIKKDMLSGTPVLFIGCPCQVAFVRKSLGAVPQSCVMCDLRCRGYSNPKKLSGLVDDISKKGTVTGIDFRPMHKKGVISCSIDGIPDSVVIKNNDFTKDVMPMCRKCRFNHGIGYRSGADITAGDFWDNKGNRMNVGSEFTPEKGCNIVCVKTEKGMRLFNSISGGLRFIDLDSIQP